MSPGVCPVCAQPWGRTGYRKVCDECYRGDALGYYTWFEPGGTFSHLVRGLDRPWFGYIHTKVVGR